MTIRSLALHKVQEKNTSMKKKKHLSISMMGSESCSLKMLFFPFMAQGHIFPMINMAKLFASRGVNSIVLTTPANAPSVQHSINSADAAAAAGVVELHLIPFPSAEAGLPDGCENVSSVPSPDLLGNFFKATSMLRTPFESAIRSLAPDCVVTDMFFPWSLDAASALGVPRLVFYGFSFFAMCATHSVSIHKALETDGETVVIPGLPHRIEMLKSQFEDPSKTPPALQEILLQMRESGPKSYGNVVNSFYELEPEYAEHYRRVIGRAWHVGPLGAMISSEEAARNACLSWLDRRSRGSVVYVCFGSVGRFSDEQLREIAEGLEAAGRPFVWVVRTEGCEWLPAGYEDRIRGMIVRGWAPQKAILNHEAVGGFVTHCGWNSSLEGIAAGLPLATWPIFAEQFHNERLIVDVLKIGVSMGVRKYGTDPREMEVIEGGKVREVVERLMGEGEEAEERRTRATKLGEMAEKAVEEGGSSYLDVGNLIEELRRKRRTDLEGKLV